MRRRRKRRRRNDSPRCARRRARSRCERSSTARCDRRRCPVIRRSTPPGARSSRRSAQVASPRSATSSGPQRKTSSSPASRWRQHPAGGRSTGRGPRRVAEARQSEQRQRATAVDVEARLEQRLAEAASLATLDASLAAEIARQQAAIARRIPRSPRRQLRRCPPRPRRRHQRPRHRRRHEPRPTLERLLSAAAGDGLPLSGGATAARPSRSHPRAHAAAAATTSTGSQRRSAIRRRLARLSMHEPASPSTSRRMRDRHKPPAGVPVAPGHAGQLRLRKPVGRAVALVDERSLTGGRWPSSVAPLSPFPCSSSP